MRKLSLYFVFTIFLLSFFSCATNINVRVNRPAKIDLSYAILPKCELDLSEVEDLNLTEADLSQVINLKLPRNAKKLELRHTKLPVFDMDLSGVERLKMARELLFRAAMQQDLFHLYTL